MKKVILSCLLLFCYSSVINAQPGKLDSSFGNNGILINNFGKGVIISSNGSQALASPDGSIYILMQTQGYGFIAKRDINGKTDKTYGKNGFSNRIINAYRAALQPDGKIVVAGYALSRLNIDGSIDTTFGYNGIYITDFQASALAIQNDGKIVIAGSTYNDNGSFFAIARFNSHGRPDSTFGNDGKQTTEFGINTSVSSAALQNDGKIVVVGNTSENKGNSTLFLGAIARYDENGALDTSFSKDGKQTRGLVDSSGSPIGIYLSSVVVQKDGKIITAGSCLIRFNIDGTPDNTFAGFKEPGEIFGKLRGAAITNIALQTDGKIVGSGYAAISHPNYDFAVVRFNANGNLDNSFSEDGIQSTDFNGRNEGASSIFIQTNGKILVAGTDGDCEFDNCSNKFAVARYNINGALDSSFNGDGKLTGAYQSGNSSFGSFAIQKDGKIVVIGGSDNKNFIARYNANGKSLDKTFNANGILYDTLPMTSVFIQADQKIVAAGNRLARYNIDGSADTSFGDHGKQTVSFGLSAAAIQTDGKIVVAGSIEIVDTLLGDYYDAFAVTRFNTNGRIDSTFNGGEIQKINFYTLGQRANSVAIAPEGRIIVAGTLFTGKHQAIAIAELNNAGSLKYAKQITRYSDDEEATSVAVQNDGKVIVIGRSIYRVKTDGSPDSSFSEDGRAFGSLINSSVTVQTDNKILIGGSDFKGNFALARFNTFGNLDSTFNQTGIQITDVGYHASSRINDIAIFDNKIYAAGTTTDGSFGSYGVMTRYLLTGNAPPIVKITTPKSDTIYTAPGRIKINVEALPVNATITKVEFYNGTTLLHTETVYPYGFVWRNVPGGNYTLTAKALDDSGFAATSAPVKISVVSTIAPTVNIIHPANNRISPGPSNISIEADAKDPDGNVAKVDYYNGLALLGTVTDSPYIYIWKNVNPGKYAITAKATDNMGIVTASSVINITVVPNQPPTVNITNPANEEYFTAPADIPLVASAKDADGRITRVKFYNGATLLRTEYKAPYRYLWRNVPSGTYTITAVARDNLAYGTTSTPITIKVITPNARTVNTPSFPGNDKTDFSATNSLSITPNPATNIINIYIKGLEKNKSITINVFSGSGSLVKSLQVNGTSQSIQFDVSSLSAGVYTLKVICGDKVTYRQFLKL